MKARYLMPVIIAAPLTPFYARDDGPGVLPAGRYLPESPENRISNVELAFNGPDVNLRKAAPAPDVIFYFSPAAVGRGVNGYAVPPSWTYDDFPRALGNVFKTAHQIESGVGAIAAPTTTPTN